MSKPETKVVFNPFTGRFDYVSSAISKKEIAQMFLIDSKQDTDFPVASLLFDDDSVLYNDDDAEL